MKQHDSYKKESVIPGERGGHDLGGKWKCFFGDWKVLIIDQGNGY